MNMSAVYIKDALNTYLAYGVTHVPAVFLW